MPLQTRPRPTSPPSPSSLLHRRPSPPSPASSTLTYLAGHGHEGHEHAQGPVRTKKWNRADPDGKANGRAKRKKESRPCLSSQPATTIIAPCRHRPPCLVRLVPSAPVRLTSTPKPPQWNLKKCRDRPWRARTAARGPGRRPPATPLTTLSPPWAPCSRRHHRPQHSSLDTPMRFMSTPLLRHCSPPFSSGRPRRQKNGGPGRESESRPTHPSSRPPVLFFPAFSPAHTSPPFTSFTTQIAC